MTHNYKLKYLKYKNKYLNLQNIIGGNFIDPSYPPDFNFGNKNTLGLLLPHAGSKYIKSIMDYTFSDINIDNFKKIIILSTNHHNKDNYEIIKKYEEYEEHSFQSIIPYINKIKIDKNVKIYVIGSFDEDFINKLDLSDSLIIGNTDLLHCGPNYNNKCPENIFDYNNKIINNITNNSLTNNDICGYAATQTFLFIINKLNLKYVEHVYNSSDKITHLDELDKIDKINSVGYVGILYNQTGQADLLNNKYILTIPKSFIDYIFNNNDNIQNIIKSELIKSFRKYIKNSNYLLIKDINGIFVTINKNNSLRGCIGTFNLQGDIIDTILNMTYNSAFQDSRFDKLTKEEIYYLTYKINFLKNPFEVNIINNFTEVIEKFIVGLHGITVFFNATHSTYLASVMIEHFNLKPGKLNLEELNKIIISLKNKANTTEDITRIELYECIEI